MAALARGRWRGPLATLVALAYAVPGSALAVGIVVGYSGWLDGSVLIILLAYLAKLWCSGTARCRPRSTGCPPGLTRAARLSGAGPVTAVRTVVLPPLAVALPRPARWCVLAPTCSHVHHLVRDRHRASAVTIVDTQTSGGVGATAALAWC